MRQAAAPSPWSAVTVRSVADAPVATDDVANTAEESPVAIDVVANDGDVDGDLDPSTVAVTAGPAHGSVVVNPVSGVVTYTPDADFHGTDAFTYRVCDAAANCATAVASVSVSAQ